jgi:ribosome maturation factor RimP
MSKKDEYVIKVEKLVEPLMIDNNFELVDVEYLKEGAYWYLRVFIDKDEGIAVDDCAIVSRALSDILDEKDFIEDSYILEVSSPGLGRQLKKDKDFTRSIGEEVEIKLYRNMKIDQGGKMVSMKELVGILKKFDNDKITIEIDQDMNIDILRTDIAMVRLALNF